MVNVFVVSEVANAYDAGKQSLGPKALLGGHNMNWREFLLTDMPKTTTTAAAIIGGLLERTKA
jgi:hypothetical protein